MALSRLYAVISRYRSNPQRKGSPFRQVGGQRLAVIARGESRGNQLGQVHRRVRRTVSEELSVGEYARWWCR